MPALTSFRRFFPLDGFEIEGQITYKLKGRNGLLWLKTATNIINDNDLPLEAHTYSNVLGINYATTSLVITVKN